MGKEFLQRSHVTNLQKPFTGQSFRRIWHIICTKFSSAQREAWLHIGLNLMACLLDASYPNNSVPQAWRPTASLRWLKAADSAAIMILPPPLHKLTIPLKLSRKVEGWVESACLFWVLEHVCSNTGGGLQHVCTFERSSRGLDGYNRGMLSGFCSFDGSKKHS